MQMKIDLIMGADALRPPLTGIGRYTYELARRLADSEDIARLRYFSMGQWVEDPIAALSQPVADDAPVAAPERKTLRDHLSSSRVAVRVFAALTPALFGWRLRGNKAAIYHSPNYIVPPFSGKTVSTVHDLSHLVHPEFHPQARVDYLRLALAASLVRTDQVITVSETVRQEMLAHKLMSEDRIQAIPLAADRVYRPHSSELLVPAMQALGLRRGLYSLFVGTVEPRKNVERLIEAYALLPVDLRREWPLVIAGGKGWNSEAVHARMAKAQAEGWLRYLSFVDQRWLPALYAGARLFVYPSLYEGFGLPIVEAMASGTPVLTSNTSCMPEVAAGAAYLVNPLDVEELGHGLEQCLTDEGWQANARVKGLERSSQLSWDRCASETVAVYKQLV
ncbi:glycosyltransferase family 4 protein [Lampropedia puyangensis]|uniref:Glycosyltransferase family 4 protein n=1 Tax=Lampropedia puyangensis TaxID=1330072 RepID=A0A4S8F5W6_9BURK|nr:glycosyltransferase family 1 protein [Lampropedia puyangensis]THU02833.1 glycosyltransferase family 4 protein [Lampropedia puyangensis]